MRRHAWTGWMMLTFGVAWALGTLGSPAPADAGGPCMYEAASGQHKQCANAGGGKCHHYTSACKAKCMYDPGSQTHKECANASNGKCHHYTSPCKAKCMYDPGSQTYKGCANASNGKCHHYTAPCTP